MIVSALEQLEIARGKDLQTGPTGHRQHQIGSTGTAVVPRAPLWRQTQESTVDTQIETALRHCHSIECAYKVLKNIEFEAGKRNLVEPYIQSTSAAPGLNTAR
jgi:hypothetical protein